MNTTSIPGQRRPAGPVRQHSLQQPIIRRPQQQIRRQRSTDDERSLQQQHSRVRFANSNNNTTSSNAKNDQHHCSNVPPKVRVAWNDPLVKPASDDNVEIVARQIPTIKPASRPATGRSGRAAMGRSSLGEKATILYSRQELAERLRLAWRQREENKANIDIFLAHNTVEERCDSGLSSPASPNLQPDETSSSEVETVARTKEAFTITTIGSSNDGNDESSKANECDFQAWLPSIEPSKLALVVPENRFPAVIVTADGESKEERDDDKRAQEDEEAEEAPREKKSFISINCHEWKTSVTISRTGTLEETKIPKDSADFSQAKLKRASFQSGLNKAFNVPVVDKSPIPRVSSRASSINSNSSQETSRFRRTNSAPPQRRAAAAAAAAAGQQQAGDNHQAADANDVGPEQSSRLKSSARPIKSATSVKRRSKLSKRRASSVNGSKDDVTDDGKGRPKGKAAGTAETRNSDVVTMVSLISSADSESEMDENSLRDDKLICELRNKLPTTPISKSASGLSGSFRKPFKSVSFQQDSFDSPGSPRSSNLRDDDSRGSLRARFNALSKSSSIAGVEKTPLLTAATLTLSSWRLEPSLEPAQPQTTRRFADNLSTSPNTETVVLTDREKRCLAVPIGDVHDKKRKLVRCRSAVSEVPRISDTEKHSSSSSSSSSSAAAAASQACLRPDIRLSQIDSRAPSNAMQENVAPKTTTNPMMATEEPPLEKDKNLPREPYGQTPKEKECWHLYRRMCDKGVFVSFDTVLRGMLTPTEYRLRQKEVSQNC